MFFGILPLLPLLDPDVVLTGGVGGGMGDDFWVSISDDELDAGGSEGREEGETEGTGCQDWGSVGQGEGEGFSEPLDTGRRSKLVGPEIAIWVWVWPVGISGEKTVSLVLLSALQFKPIERTENGKRQ